MSLGATILCLVFGAVLMALGIAAYSGRDRSWMITKKVLPGQSGPALLYFGIFLFLLPMAVPLMDVLPPIFAALLGLLLLGCMFIGVLGFFWLPRFMHPRWMRDEYRRDNERMRRDRSTRHRDYGQ